MSTHPAGALARLVGDVPTFMEEVWGQRPRRWVRACPDGFSDLLTLEDVDTLLMGAGLRAPAVRLVRDGQPIPVSAYTTTARIGGRSVTDMLDPEAVLAEVGTGASLVLQALHRYVPAITSLCRRLEELIGHPLQTNAYLTPSGSRGLPVHHDTHDVIVVQLYGQKRWTLFEPTMEHPVVGYPRSPRYDDPPPVWETFELARGDTLYLPRGIPHRAETMESVSLHLTIGIRSPTWLDVFERVVARAKERPEFRRSLPVGYASRPERFEVEVAAMLGKLAEWVAAVDPVEVAVKEARRVRDARLPERRGRLRALLDLEAITDDTKLERATELVWSLEPEGDDRVTLRAGKVGLRFPARARPALEALVAVDELTPSALSAYLDVAGRLVLARRLVREGVLRRRSVDDQ